MTPGANVSRVTAPSASGASGSEDAATLPPLVHLPGPVPDDSSVSARALLAAFRSRLVTGAASAFILQVVSQVLAFVVGILLARVLGSTGFGIYSNAWAWVQLLAIPATMGINQLMVREVAKYSGAGEWGLARSFFRWANLNSLCASALLAALGGVAAWILWGGRQPEMFASVLLALAVLLPLSALTNLRQTAMRGLGRVAAGLYPDMLVRPVLLIVLVGAAAIAVPDVLTPSGAVGIAVVATGVAYIAGTLTLIRGIPRGVGHVSVSRQQRRAWLASAAPMLFLGGMQVLIGRTGTVVLGATHDAVEVGVFAAASRGAAVIGFALMAINMALAPMVARLYAAGDMVVLQRLITRSAQAALGATVILAGVISGFAEPFLLLFGRDFATGVNLVWIMAIGQVVSGAMGSVGVILIMTGHERMASRGLATGAAVTVLLSALLIPGWGAVGAAIADAAALAVVNVILCGLLYRATGLQASAIPLFGRRVGRVSPNAGAPPPDADLW